MKGNACVDIEYPLIRQAGEAAVLVEFGAELDLATNNAAQAFDARVTEAGCAGILETTPTLRSVLVRYDPLTASAADLQSQLGELLAERDWLTSQPPAGRKLWRIPAVYGNQYGADLTEVAELLDTESATVIEKHAEQRLRVLTLGFSPGFTYLGLLPPEWNLPRLSYVKPEVPAGAISVAVRQTVMTSTPIPTGWRTIAQTPFSNFNLLADPPFAISPGDEIAFRSISSEEYLALKHRVDRGDSIVEPERCQ